MKTIETEIEEILEECDCTTGDTSSAIEDIAKLVQREAALRLMDYIGTIARMQNVENPQPAKSDYRVRWNRYPECGPELEEFIDGEWKEVETV